MKKILILHTGGTIAMEEDETTGTVSQTENHPLNQVVKKYANIAEVEEHILFDVPSPQMTPTLMVELVNKIRKVLPIYDGIVITHGTDTLEETAYFLDLVLETDKPIIITGAMRSSNELGSDALSNVISSLRVAASDTAFGKGVLVVMNEEIHAAKFVTKTSTTDLATFKSVTYGPIGHVLKQEIHFEQLTLKRNQFPISKVDSDVILLTSYAGMDGKIIEAIHGMKPDGLVIEAFGQGNLPATLVKPLQQMMNAKIPVVIVSRCHTGHVQPTYGYDGGGRHLQDLGIIFAKGLTGPKARLKLLVCLEKTKDFSKLNDLLNS